MKLPNFKHFFEENPWLVTPIALACFLAVLLILSSLKTCQSVKQINEEVAKNHQSSTPVIIQKYDPATQNKIDSIEAYRQRSHRHVDNLYDNELQDLLDSVYNSR